MKQCIGMDARLYLVSKTKIAAMAYPAMDSMCQETLLKPSAGSYPFRAMHVLIPSCCFQTLSVGRAVGTSTPYSIGGHVVRSLGSPLHNGEI